jgi:hypothetical protein
VKLRISKTSTRLAISFLLATVAALPQTKSALETNPKGWRDIMPDASFKGWTRVPIPPDAPLKPEESLWKLDPVHHIVICEGDKLGHEWLRYDKQQYSDAIFHVEFRFVPVDTPNPKYNSGVFVRNSKDGKIWYQGQATMAGGYLFGDNPVNGEIKRFTLVKQQKGQKVNPAGEWNTYELEAIGNKISLWVNGAVNSEFTECGNPKGYVGLEAEGWRVEFRNVKVKDLK